MQREDKSSRKLMFNAHNVYADFYMDIPYIRYVRVKISNRIYLRKCKRPTLPENVYIFHDSITTKCICWSIFFSSSFSFSFIYLCSVYILLWFGVRWFAVWDHFGERWWYICMPGWRICARTTKNWTICMRICSHKLIMGSCVCEREIDAAKWERINTIGWQTKAYIKWITVMYRHTLRLCVYVSTVYACFRLPDTRIPNSTDECYECILFIYGFSFAQTHTRAHAHTTPKSEF